MKILLLGGYGLLGSDIYNVLVSKRYEVVRYTKRELNLMDRKKLETVLKYYNPQIVINAAGYTDVNRAQNDFQSAFDINCIGTYNLVYSLKKIDAKLIYISTDYIFNGEKNEPYTEEDEALPLNNYGWTKLVSEDIIRANYKNYYIIRTSWLFGLNGRCFPKIILDKLKNNKKVEVVEDQIGSPTYTIDLAENILDVVNLPYGIYNITNSGNTSWYDYAKLIAEYAGLDSSNIIPIKTNKYFEKVKRPSYSVLSNSKWKSYNRPLRHFSEALRDFIDKVI
ncbi:dTDP-4-dehydrorhamnose reductase [Caloranaerobacter azorensis]|uniref:dTDP-4-dehydrorhamnose reductase n=1 Tax=Caloranaerobacter azorensis TaxID=116090 RepID=A0A6P1YER8_9FIRM|nr:dTDP-4-dehydrorhamnose reductase [Caloranaerobacter azorensis]QIB27587.1 dTDP-4-dehydrorhamnose reductase [Caloranaerobacter azorensis]